MKRDSGDVRRRYGDSGRVEFVPRSVGHHDVATLLKAFYDEQVGRYGFAESVALESGTYDPPNGLFVVIYCQGDPVGCGGCRCLGDQHSTIEIKKTYLRPETRGRGLGRKLLRWLEDQGVLLGAQRLILETGIRNTAALGLFTSSGYLPFKSYVPGRDPLINRAFLKTIAGFSAEDYQLSRV